MTKFVELRLMNSEFPRTCVGVYLDSNIFHEEFFLDIYLEYYLKILIFL